MHYTLEAAQSTIDVTLGLDVRRGRSREPLVKFLHQVDCMDVTSDYLQYRILISSSCSVMKPFCMQLEDRQVLYPVTPQSTPIQTMPLYETQIFKYSTVYQQNTLTLVLSYVDNFAALLLGRPLGHPVMFGLSLVYPGSCPRSPRLSVKRMHPLEIPTSCGCIRFLDMPPQEKADHCLADASAGDGREVRWDEWWGDEVDEVMQLARRVTVGGDGPRTESVRDRKSRSRVESRESKGEGRKSRVESQMLGRGMLVLESKLPQLKYLPKSEAKSCRKSWKVVGIRRIQINYKRSSRNRIEATTTIVWGGYGMVNKGGKGLYDYARRWKEGWKSGRWRMAAGDVRQVLGLRCIGEEVKMAVSVRLMWRPVATAQGLSFDDDVSVGCVSSTACAKDIGEMCHQR
ncbi:hypothetical protein C8Q74DRAFT_1218966 [Fomes fomentarius]|nr:hypothetical protein C8Q74DRAFT_1218966 [Fomes fomentarius]